MTIINELLMMCIGLQEKDSMIFLIEELEAKLKGGKVQELATLKRSIDEIIVEEGQLTHKS